ncbi:MAG: S1/P1 nuclease [Thermoanaerobaculia bacterium]|nr:S1/P1 nuclease [Thermoanaerobaculia bacterium]
MKPPLRLALAMALLAGPAFGWGPTGHRVVGLVAERHLSPAAARAVGELLGPDSLAEVATWADDMRSDSTWKPFEPFHFVSIEDGETYEQSTKNPNGDLFTALARFEAQLADQAAAPADRRAALAWLVHLVGDLHQPLHVGRASDQGGNTILVTWFGEISNLHTVWDDKLIDHTRLSFTEFTNFLDPPSPETLAAWRTGTYLEWARESQDLRAGVYELGDRKLGYSYSFTHLPTIRQRLLQAGVRLAAVLERALVD